MPTSGKYWLDGQEMSRLTPNQRALVRTEKIGFVFQNFNLLARTTAVQNVVMPLDYVRASPLRRRSPPLGADPAGARGAGRPGRSRAVADVRAGSSSGWPSAARWSTGPRWCWPTSRPATSIRTPASKSCGCSSSSTRGNHRRPGDARSAGGRLRPSHHPHRGRPDRGRRDATLAVGRRRTPKRGRRREPASQRLRLLELHLERSVPAERDGDAGPAPSLLPATWRTALAALRRNKMRSGLSALGVIIAVAAVIAMTEIGQGSKAALQKGIASMGANTLMIFSGATSTGGVNLGTGSAMTLTPQDADEIARQCPAVSAVAPMVRARAQIVYGNRNWVPEQISGTTPSFLVVRDWQNMAAGRDVHRPRRPQRQPRSA